MSMPMKTLTLSLPVTYRPAALPARPREKQGAAIKVATFDVDATPPLGSVMAYEPVKRLDELTLRCRGTTGAAHPYLCA